MVLYTWLLGNKRHTLPYNSAVFVVCVGSTGSAINLDDSSSKDPPPVDDITVTKDSINRTSLQSAPSRDSLEKSVEVGTEVLADNEGADEWVSLSSDTHPLQSHPLTHSGD